MFGHYLAVFLSCILTHLKNHPGLALQQSCCCTQWAT
jgi:multisubunit Na+/H+ antiporter MnhB subunit